MTSIHANLNRPIYLARRDAFYERGIELLYLPIQEMDTEKRIDLLKKVLAVLGIARRQAFFASRSLNRLSHEPDFLRFLELIHDNVKSMLSMMEQQEHLEASESFLCQFLKTSREQCQLPASHYRRRAEDLMNGLWQLLRLAHGPYRGLQEEFKKDARPNEWERYQKAFSSFREESMSRYPTPEAVNAPVAS